jgi:outer membrane protein
MKIIHYVIESALLVAVLLLFALRCGDGGVKGVSSEGVRSGGIVDRLPIAYINIDSLLSSYNFSKDLNEQLVRKQENARANLTQQLRSFQSDVENFQYKVQNGAFATQSRAESEQSRLQKRQRELEELEDRLTQGLMEETRSMNERLRDTIVMHLREFNATHGYQLIFSNSSGSPVILADGAYNITAEVIEYLNSKWSPSK